jgi:signal transduction histidine kinase
VENRHVAGEDRYVAEEHAALRRVATLVARGAPRDEVFQAVAAEAGRLLGARTATVLRVESAQSAVVEASWAQGGAPVPVGSRGALDGRGLVGRILRTRAAVRIDDFDDVGGAVARQMRDLGIRSGVGGPIVVGGRIWGALGAAWPEQVPPPQGAEHLLASFAELVAASLYNSEARESLIASRARIVAAADEERRRIERNLHDGAQQRLVALTLELRTAQASASGAVGDRIERVIEGLNEVLDDVREISRGLHPAILTRAGLEPALKALARRAVTPVELAVEVEERLPEAVEIATYYAVSEALANAGKHAGATAAVVRVDCAGGELTARISDDGAGGASLEPGHGLIGLRDRIEAIGGRLTLDSPPGSGTTLVVDIPIPASR